MPSSLRRRALTVSAVLVVCLLSLGCRRDSFQLSGIRLRIGKEQVRHALGTPDKVEPGSSTELWIYMEKGIKVRLDTTGFSSEPIVTWVLQSKGAHSSGVRIGDPIAKAEKVFGKGAGRDLYYASQAVNREGQTLDVVMAREWSSDGQVVAFILSEHVAEPLVPPGDERVSIRMDIDGVSLLMDSQSVYGALDQPDFAERIGSEPFGERWCHVERGLNVSLYADESGSLKVVSVTKLRGQYSDEVMIGAPDLVLRDVPGLKLVGDNWEYVDPRGQTLTFYVSEGRIYGVGLSLPEAWD